MNSAINIGTVATGFMTHAFNGLTRIPAILASCTSVMMVGELAIRGLSASLSAIGREPSDSSYIGKATAWISNSPIRPYKNEAILPLVAKTVAMVAVSVLAFEAASLLCGPAPAIYNTALTFMGPIRLDGGSYIQNVTPYIQSLAHTWSTLSFR